jgi:4-aminobutyrate aminotransferase-like enzyme/Ser/Thr protein kinase RdoA (MazF antagonist)
LLALRSAPPAFGIDEAGRIAHEVYGLAVSVRPLSGERDCNFHIRSGDADFVLKIVDGAADPDATDCQVRVLRHLAEQDPGLPVPRLHATQAGADLGSVERDGVVFATCLVSYIRGTPLANRAADLPLLKNVGATLARVDRALQGFFHPALGRRIAWDVRRLPELLEFAPYLAPATGRRVHQICRALQERLPAVHSLRGQAIHGDCHAANVLVDPAAGTVCGVLDFGDMIHGPLVLEPAVAMAELPSGVAGAAALRAIIEGYCTRQPLLSAEIEVLFDLISARHAVTTLVHAWRAVHDPAGARLLDAAVANAARALDLLFDIGRVRLTRDWQDAAGTSPPDSPRIDMNRRRRLLGAGAELFYEQPLHLVRGDGVWLYDPQERRYLDVYNNVPHVGHCHPTVVRAVQRQVARLATHTRYLHETILDYAEALTARCPAPLDTCIFVNSGSEANDVAWRLAQFATGRQGAVIMAHAYHGITAAVAALTPGAGQPRDPRVVTLAPPPAAWSAAVADDELAGAILAAVTDAAGAVADGATLAAVADDAERALHTLASRGHAPAAWFIDSALTSSGIFDPPPAWLATVAVRLRAAGALIVADEVQYGLGRSGSHFWGFERRGLVGPGLAPDIVTLGKPLGNGFPMGVVIAERRLVEAFQREFGFFSTFGGNPVAAAAGLAVLGVLEDEQLMANARATGDYLRRRLKAVAARHACLGQVRGCGFLLGLEVLGPEPLAAKARTRAIVNTLASRDRILIGSEGPLGNILKMRPPMPLRPEQADLLAQAIDAAAATVA